MGSSVPGRSFIEAPPTTIALDGDSTGLPEWRTYTNLGYGFSFQFPPRWDLMDGRNFIRLSRGSMSLVVGFRHVTEDPNVCCRDLLPEGEVIEAGTVACAGESVSKALLSCDGRTKAVLYEGTREIAVDDLRFLFYLEDFTVDHEGANISDEVIEEVDAVVASLETFEPLIIYGEVTPTWQAPPTDAALASPASAAGRPTPTLTPTPDTTPTPTATVMAAQAESKGANVRSGPGLDYGLEGFLEAGEWVPITGRHGEWWQIAYKERSAWVYDGVVQATGTDGVAEVDAVPTPVPPSPAVIPTPAPPAAVDEERWIDVDLSEQRLRAYEDGEVVRTTLVSTGLPDTPTPTGQFRIWIKLLYDDMSGPDYYLEDVPYAMYFYRGYGLHGTYWHDNFGQPMSHGCVNLPTSEAEWLFEFADVGTLVNVHR